MKSEREIREKINSLFTMLDNVKQDEGSQIADQLINDIQYQIDMLLWVIGDESGLPPLDEDDMYSCYQYRKET